MNEAVEELLRMSGTKMTHAALSVVREWARALQTRSERALPTEAANAAGAPESGEPRVGTEPVQYVHQIYGLFRDSKPMNDRFKASHEAWKACAARMNAVYHLWNADEVDTLMRTRYPAFWDTYKNVRYPIMRVDIGRIAILHSYGGLYADLDTTPNRLTYGQAQLALQSVLAPTTWRESEGEGHEQRLAGRQPVHEQWDMEVLVGAAGAPVFLRWLQHMSEEIGCREYHSEASFWRTARMRYVFHTTGPLAMEGFL